MTAIQRNTKDSGIGYIARFRVKKAFMDKYPIQKVGGVIHTEWWISAEDLNELNTNIVGLIQLMGGMLIIPKINVNYYS